MTLGQAKLLEKALTGVHPDTTAAKTKRSKTKLVVDPKAPEEPPPPRPALDIVILLDVSDNTALTRHLHTGTWGWGVRGLCLVVEGGGVRAVFVTRGGRFTWPQTEGLACQRCIWILYVVCPRPMLLVPQVDGMYPAC